MLERYQDDWTNAWIAQWRATPGIVALDFDTPGPWWERDDLWETYTGRVAELCQELSRLWDLGHFWTYKTGSPGLHIIFEKPSPKHWKTIIKDAAGREHIHSCLGHRDLCTNVRGYVALRVGCKRGRDFDIEPLPTPTATPKPTHVLEHEALLSLRLPATWDEQGWEEC